MPDACIARQPIFDRKLEVIGYELLFRDPPALTANVIDHAAATTSVILNTLTEIGLQRVVNGRPAWINASRDFLLGGSVEMLPAARVGMEILEDEAIDDALIEAVRRLTGQGYRFALDDFRFREDAVPLLGLVDVVKLDLLALGRAGLADHVALLSPYGIDLLAEKVETPEDHEFCLALGCQRFQGYFYRRPELLSGRRIESSRVSLVPSAGRVAGSDPGAAGDRAADRPRRRGQPAADALHQLGVRRPAPRGVLDRPGGRAAG